MRVQETSNPLITGDEATSAKMLVSSTVPEPGTMLLLGSGLVGLLGWRRRQNKKCGIANG